MPFLLIQAGNWTLARWLSAGIQGRVAEREELQLEVEQLRRERERLGTWGLDLVEQGGKRWLRGSRRLELTGPVESGGQQWWLLSSD